MWAGELVDLNSKSSVPFQSDSLFGWLAKTIEYFTENNLTYASVPSVPTESEAPTAFECTGFTEKCTDCTGCTDYSECVPAAPHVQALWDDFRLNFQTWSHKKKKKVSLLLNSHKTLRMTLQVSPLGECITYLRKRWDASEPHFPFPSLYNFKSAFVGPLEWHRMIYSSFATP